MVHVSGPRQTASSGSNTHVWSLKLLNNVKGRRRSLSRPSRSPHKQPPCPKGLIPLDLSSPRCLPAVYSGSRGSVVLSATSHAASGRGSGGSKQWSGSWASVTGSIRGSYEEGAGEAYDAAAEGPHHTELQSRAGKLVALGGAVALELLITGSLVWTPLAAAFVALVVLPGAPALTAAQSAAREAEAVARAEARVRAEMAAQVPVSPLESAVWMCRLMGELWQPFVQPLVLGENLGHWADKVRRAAPAGLELQLEEMSLGREAPQMSNFQVLADPATGRVTGINCDMAFDSSTMRVVVSGSGPLGRFSATMTGISMRGRMRLLPIPDQRMLLFSFREPPQIDPKLTLEGPFLGARDIPPTSLLRSLLAATLQDCLVEPVRGAVSLDPEPLVGQPVDTIVNIYIESVQGVLTDGSAPEPGSPPPPAQEHPAGPRSPQPQPEDASLPAFLSPLVHDAAPPMSTSTGGGGNGGSATSAVVAAASNAAVAASEAVVEGAGAIASLVPGLSAVAGASAAEGAGRGARQRMLQVVAINTDSKLQRETTPVPYQLAAPSTGNSGRGGDTAAASGGAARVLQMVKLNVGHKDTIYKLLVREVGRGGLVGSVTGMGSGPSVGVGGSPPTSSTSSSAATSSPTSPPLPPSSGTTSAASSTPTSMAAAVVSGLPTPGLLGSVRLHVAAAKDGSTLFWAAGPGGEPMAVRWRPSEGPWRVTLPLESPTYGLPPPAPPTAAPSRGPQATQAAKDGSPQPGGPGGNPVVGSNGSKTKGFGKSPYSGSGNKGNDSSSSSKRRGGSSNGKAVDGSQHTSASAASHHPRSLPEGFEDHREAAAASQPTVTPSSPTPNGSDTGAAGAHAHVGAGGGGGSQGSAAGAQQEVPASSTSTTTTSSGQTSSGAPSITLLISADPWVYKDAVPPGSNPYDNPRPRSLVLQVVEARDLAAHDWAGTCDPYVWISYNGRTYRTRTLYNAHTPVWQQTFILADGSSAISPNIPPRNRLSLSVYDSGVSRDDQLGSASLNLDGASEHLLQDRWIPLLGVESGWLRVRLAAVPDSPDSAAVRCVVEALQRLIPRGSEPLLQVVVLAARSLSPRRGAQLLGLRDAYCNIVYGGARHVTPVVRQSQNPRWDFSTLFIMQHDEDAEGQVDDREFWESAGGRWEALQTEADEVAATLGSVVRGDPASSSSHAGEDAGRRGSGYGNGNGSGASSQSDIKTGNRQSAAPTDSKGASLKGGHPDVTGRRRGEAGRSGKESGVSRAGKDDKPQLPPYPAIPGNLEVLEAVKPPPLQAGGAARFRPRPRFRRGFNRDMLRLEIRDVAPVPPDEDLGWVELPVRALLPQPGDSWQGWLPLRRGGGAELLVQITRIEPLPLGHGRLPTALKLQQQEPTSSGSGAAPSVSPIAQQGSSVGDADTKGGDGSSSSGGAGGRPQQRAVALMERIRLENFTEQVRAANRAAGQVGQDLRVRLGQDVIPKLQDWLEGTLQHTMTTFDQQTSEVRDWLRNPQLLPSAWMAGISAMSGKAPSKGQQKMLASPPSSSSRLLNQVQDVPVEAGEEDAVSGKMIAQQLTVGSMENIRATDVAASTKQREQVSAEGTAREQQPAVSTAADKSTSAVTNTAVNSEVNGTTAGDQGQGIGFVGKADKGDRMSANRRYSMPSVAIESGGLGQRFARIWEQLLGPPAYKPKGQAEDSNGQPLILQQKQQQQEEND